MIDKAEFAKIIAMIAALYPQQFKATATTIKAYYSILCDLPVELLKAAVLHICSDGREWPPPAGVIRATAFSLIEHNEGAVTAGEAWQEARRILGDPSRYYPGINATSEDDFSDPAIFATIQAVGAMDIVHTPEDMIHTTRARFMDTFKTIKNRQRTTATMLPVVRAAVDSVAPPVDTPRQIEARTLMKELTGALTVTRKPPADDVDPAFQKEQRKALAEMKERKRQC